MGVGNFSKDQDGLLAHALSEGFSGVRIEQGVPLLDRDLNLLSQLPFMRMRELFSMLRPDGVEGVDSFRIQALESSDLPSNQYTSDFIIGSGLCLAGGLRVENSKETRYSDHCLELGVPSQITAPVSRRTDLVFLDVFEIEVDNSTHLEFGNSDIGLRTSIRLKPTWQVRVLEGWDEHRPLLPPRGHWYVPLAHLEQTPGRPNAPQDRRLLPSQNHLERRVSALEHQVARLNQQLHRGELDHDSRRYRLELSAPATSLFVFGHIAGPAPADVASNQQGRLIMGGATRSAESGGTSIAEWGIAMLGGLAIPRGVPSVSVENSICRARQNPDATPWGTIGISEWNDARVTLELSLEDVSFQAHASFIVWTL